MEFIKFCEENRIKWQFIVLDTPQQNGVFKHKNWTLVGTIVAMLSHWKLSNTCWGEILSTTNYLQNKSPTEIIPSGKTFIEVWTGKKPNHSHLKGFGSKVFALIQKHHQSKLDHHTIECTFLGYSDESKAYRLMKKYDKSVFIFQDIIFEEVSNVYVEAIDKIHHPFQLTLRISF